MTADTARDHVTAARDELSGAMRALSRPRPDGEAAVRSLRACADLCDMLIVTIVIDKVGGKAWK